MEIKSANNDAVDSLNIFSHGNLKERARQRAEKYNGISICSTCKATGFILAPDEENFTEKKFIEECPDCNS
jgi:Zn finger protein HypA/HybF involved in hydrogenase expression